MLWIHPRISGKLPLSHKFEAVNLMTKRRLTASSLAVRRQSLLC
ncbi:hypothetical protein E2C01_089991 [Portunus trituberculatus]|uniref:Uncharacterized protein n=1 Tax=Portunus trituberculatus TaxID=210409 RepID=A0A5B7JJQ6_PORTR|nr:hypothetical protein [Portunus trituberculatus]